MTDLEGAAGPELYQVHIVQLPVAVFRRASEQSDELLREFALIREEGSSHIPARLLALVDELRARFAGFSTEPTAALEAALERDDETIDLVYSVPAATREAVIELSKLLDEADDFCRAGELLTLATSPEGLTFRRWFLDEFVRQIDGEPPRPWADAIGAAPHG